MTSVEVWSDIHVRCHSEDETRKVMLSLDLVQNPLDNKLKIKYFEWNETSFFACHCKLHWLHRYCLSHLIWLYMTDCCLSLVTGFLSPRLDSPLIWSLATCCVRPPPPASRVPSTEGEVRLTRGHWTTASHQLSPSLCVSLNPCLSKHTNNTSHVFRKLRIIKA